ncbi:MAG: hypothetical protein K6F68_06055 [Clostridiales bacterium]|nr:hypothetical protein [Clostridiales bacterium]
MKKTLALLMVLAMVVALLAGCKTPVDPTPTTNPTTEPTVTDEPEVTPPPMADWDGKYIERDDYKAYIKHDLDFLYATIKDQLGDSAAAVEAAVQAGAQAIDFAGTVAEIRAAYANAYQAILDAIPTYEGVATYKKLPNSERTTILGILERYAVTTGITGISLFENGGYVMYNPRITLGTENFIVGYGFGVLPEGNITEDLEYETNEAWKRYYHIEEHDDPGTLNYLNDQGAVVGDLYGYMAASFFTNFMNATKDGYDWVPELAKEKPVAVNDDDADGMCTTWRFEVRTGDDGLKYTTASQMADRAAFNNRPVALEDYEYAFKLLLTQSNQLYRGSELANTKSGAIAGAKAYYDGTAEGENEELWANVGIKTYNEGGKNYFEVTFKEEQTQFYCMYYIASSLYMPIPKEFVDLVTVTNYCGFDKNATTTPVDNSLVVGPYYVERYDADQQIVYAKNPNYVFADTKYAIPGIHVKIFTAAKEDTNAVFNEFIAGHFDVAGIPQEYLNEYRNDPRTRSTTGTSNFKLNVNATSPETWEYLFGEEGVVTQTPKEDYWESKPCLANRHFVKALSLSIDRLTFANARGSIPSVDYLASNYMIDPENGISYSVTEAHKKAVEGLLEDTDGYGFSLELAREYFRVALTELEAEGAYTPGTKENPTVIHIEIAWMYPTHEELYHNEIKNFLETAFNDESVCGGVYQLSVDFWVGNDWSDVYYNKMMVGQFDIGFGSISGNSLDPIGFVSVLSSDQEISGSFTLNWGVDTNDPDAYPIVYEGYRWSFDALYNAVNSKAIVAQGQNKASLTFEYTPIVKNDDGSYTGTLTVKATLPDLTKFNVTSIACCNYERYYNGDGTYDEFELTDFTCEDQGNGVYVITFTVPADIAADYATGSGTSENPTGYTGFDFYYDLEFDGDTQSTYYSVSEDHFIVD